MYNVRVMSGPSVCVYCRQQPMDPRWKPFCSERCQLGDLGRWLQGSYHVPGPPAGVTDDAGADGIAIDADADDPH